MRRTIWAFLVLLATVPGLAAAQDGQRAMDDGILAFREGRYTDAVRSFEQASGDSTLAAEAHFLLARVFFETDLRDTRRAGREIQQALAIEPDNVQYLVARMQQLRTESKDFFSEKVREQQRVELARRILKLDSTNAFAHEELGVLYIRDFWRYRNAVTFPKLIYSVGEYRSRTDIDPLSGRLEQQAGDVRANPDEVGWMDILEEQNLLSRFDMGPLDPNVVFMSDQFDTETLEAQGIPVMRLAGRAQAAYDRAIHHLEAALASDPRHRTVYDYMMEIYALKGEWQDALSMLQTMYVFFPDDPDLWTYLGLAHFRGGNVDAAAKAFETSLRFLDGEAQQAYADISVILSDQEKESYALKPAEYASRYWASKDPRYLTPYNERKLEHYARLTIADLLYAAPDVNLRGWQTQRGKILVRYGVPLSDVTIVPRSTSGVNQPSPAEDRSTASNPGGRVSTTLQIARQGSPVDLFEEANTYVVWDYGDFKFVFEDPFRNGEYRLYSPPASAISEGALAWANDYVIQAGETFRAVPDRFDYELPGRRIELPFLVSALRGQDGQVDLVVNYAVPLSQLPPGSDVINVTARAGLFVIDGNRDVVAERRRTLYGLRTDQVVAFDEANLWVDSEQLAIKPGPADVSVEFETASGETVGVQRRSIEAPDYENGQLAVSDVVLAYRVEESEDGRPVTGADIVRHGLSILPAPWSVFGRSRPIYLYFEVYNLRAGADGMAEYEVEAALVPREGGSGVGRLIRGIFGGGPRGVSVGLPIKVAATDDGQYLILDAANQEPGLYTLKVSVKDRVTGREAERTLDLYLE